MTLVLESFVGVSARWVRRATGGERPNCCSDDFHGRNHVQVTDPAPITCFLGPMHSYLHLGRKDIHTGVIVTLQNAFFLCWASCLRTRKHWDDVRGARAAKLPEYFARRVRPQNQSRCCFPSFRSLHADAF